MITERDVIEYSLKESLLFFTRYFYKHRHGRKFIVNEHHKIICEALDEVIRGEIKKLIINIAPRYSKTELAVKNFIAKGLAHNPKAKFIHLTYAKNLALDNSEEAKELVEHEEFQKLFPVLIKKDSKSKEKWYTESGGGVYATAAGGQVTGFGAGKVDEEEDEDRVKAESELKEFENELDSFLSDMEAANGFGGALIIDDPIKPDDANSDIKRNRINERFETTIRNRVNSRNTPIIVIQQRVHEKDLSGYLMEVEPGQWTVLRLPCLKDDGTALWPLKHTVEELLHIKAVNEYVYASQYDQDPKPIKRGGEAYKLFKREKTVVKNRMVNGLPELYNPELPLHLTFDFNVVPYMTCLVHQIIQQQGRKIARQIDEFTLKTPNNRTAAVCWEVGKRYFNHNKGMFIYGDPSGKREDTRSEKGSNDFTIILNSLSKYRPAKRVLSVAPAVVMRINFINHIFEEGFKGVDIEIGDNCVNTIADYMFGKEDSDGTKLKEMVKDPVTEQSYQKYHHCSDANDYFYCFAFASEFAKYQNGEGTGKIASGKGVSSKNDY